MQILKKLILALVLLASAGLSQTIAQCAMCRATLENNISNGEIGIAENLNLGIMYLFVMPYTAIAVVGYFWYRSSKLNEQLTGSN